MPASQAHIPTRRASRYLAQLCKHGGRMSRITFHQPPGHSGSGASPVPRHTDWSDTDGVIDFGRGRCTLHATDSDLTLLVEAEDQQQLRRIQDGIARRLERIGRRDGLTVTWQSQARAEHLTIADVPAVMTTLADAESTRLTGTHRQFSTATHEAAERGPGVGLFPPGTFRHVGQPT